MLFRRAVSESKALGENGKKAAMFLYDGAADPAAFFSDFARAYYAGANGGDPVSSSVMADAELRGAMSAGRRDAATSMQTQRTQNAPFYGKESGLVQNENSAKLGNDTAKMLDLMGRVTGKKVVLESTVNAPGDVASSSAMNGYYDPNTGTVHLDIDDIMSDDSNVAQKAGALISHEITHDIQQAAPEEYAAFRKIAVQAMEEYGSGYYSDVLISVYKNAGINLTQEQALDEVAAKYA